MTTRFFSVLTLCLGLAVVPAGALTYVHVADADLVDQAEVIARVEIVDTVVRADRGSIYTEYTARVRAAVKGRVDGADLTIKVPGGRSEELGVELRLPGAPVFSPGDRALLFLRSNPEDESLHILHFALGAFKEREVTGGQVFVRDLAEPEESRAGALGSRVGRDADRFLTWIRDDVGGLRRSADYLVALPELRPDPVTAAFTVRNPERLSLWQEFLVNPPHKVTWKRHKVGQDGVNAKKLLKKVLKGLNNTQDARSAVTAGGAGLAAGGLVNLALKGTFGDSSVPAIAGACADDNVFVFNDRSGSVRDPFDCQTGGILAVGGSCIFTPAAGQWKGQPYFAATSGRIVYNANTACYYKNQFPWTRDTGDNKFLEVTVHELLHALGLGHSCGDDDSPKCSTSALLDNATMRATTHTDGRGNRIFEDDLSGFWQFYDPNYFAAPCDLPPGHKNFCKRCGPCGLLQGACKKNSDCYGALECKSKVCS